MACVSAMSAAVRTPCNAHFTHGRPRTTVKAHSLASASSSFTAPLSSHLHSRMTRTTQPAGRGQLLVYAGNNAADGPFTPLVKAVRNVIGVKEFNQLRGKAISLHSQVIKDFCKQIGADNKQIQGLIRLAKKNGEKLGFLS